jgi:protein kinase A
MPTLGFLKRKKNLSGTGPDGSPGDDQSLSKTNSNVDNSSATGQDPSFQELKPSHPDQNANGKMTDSNPYQQTPASQTYAPITSPQPHGTIAAPGGGNPGKHPDMIQLRETKGKYTLPDFNIQRTLGTGSFGRVHLVQSKHNSRFYAIKVLKKNQVVKMKQVEHTNDERRMLAKVKHPFLVTLWGTFQDSKNLYMVMDFIEGGELFSLLRKSQVFLDSIS